MFFRYEVSMAFPRFSRENSAATTEVDILDQRLAVLNDLYSFLQTQLEVKHSNKLEPWKVRHFFEISSPEMISVRIFF